ncbi:Adenylate and Guanylate cyclase catalytic domain containing protein [Tritrichomonas foetus]|uniref:Adenylate and Guanylate cyclase catalytic domain containing protein n=1 Tax=Tritrichomonas foetus TaxID=1144522 RepID=A0A1J4JMN4_9EUKA|nr:Adenylate and Guanylate cyclase catalytic domain containing protein [Tritrichomonas foetus]|eukprot:OHS98805.1 Adenylate and Guanylate cyclase catalytic domain containing protein [Tritrichomonas foetus]
MSKYTSTSKSGLATSGILVDESYRQAEKRENPSFLTRDIFPVIAEVNRSVPAPPLLLIFQYMILYLQLFFGGYYLFHVHTGFPQSFQILIQVLFFGLAGDYRSYTPYFLSLAVVDILTLIFLIIIFVDYHNNHDFKSWQLHMMRNWNGILFSYFIIPNVFFLIISLADLGTTNSWGSTFIFLLSIATSVFTFVHIFFISNLLNQSPFLFHGAPFHWHPPELFSMVIIMSVPFAFDGFFQKMSQWLRIVPPLFTIILSPYVFYRMWYLPFTYLITNVIWASLSVGLIFGSIFSIVRDAKMSNINPTLQFLAPIIATILSWTIIYPIFYLRRRKIKNNLSYSVFPDKNITEDEKQQYFETLKIKRKSLAYTYVQVGIEEGSDMFLDWSLSKYILDHFNDDVDLMIFITWTVSFFPSETFSMHNFILTIAKKKDLTIVNQSMFYQLHRLHIFRQSSSSKEANSDLSKIKKMTEQCIASFCDVWKNMGDKSYEVNFDTYNILTRLRHSTEASWAEMLDKYPNNARFVNEYANFLLDGRCRFKEAIYYHQRANAIEQGSKIQNDRMFHRFVQMFPFYLKKSIVDTSGKLKRKQHNAGPEVGTTFADQMQNDNTTDDSSNDIDIVEGEQFVPQAQLRLALGRAVSELHSHISQKVMISAVIALCITLIYATIITVMLHNKFNESLNLFSYLTVINKISRTYEIMMPIYSWLWSGSVLKEFSTDEEFLIFGSVYQLSSYLNTDTSNDQKIYNLSLIGLSYIDELSNVLYSTDESYGKRIVNLAKLLSNTYIHTGVCNPSTNEIITEGQSSTIDYIWRTFFMSSAKLTIDSEEDRKNWVNSKTFCDVYTKHQVLSNALKTIPMNLSERFSIEHRLLNRCNTSHFLFDEKGNPLVDEDFSIESCPPHHGIGHTVSNYGQDGNYVSTNDDTIYNFLIAFSPFLILTLCLPSTIFASSGLLTEKKEYTKHLKSFSKQEREKAAERINQATLNLDETTSTIQQESKSSTLPNFLLNVFCALIITALLLVALICSTTFRHKLNAITEHYLLLGALRGTIIDASGSILMMSFLYQCRTEGYFTPNFINDIQLQESVNKKLQLIAMVQSMLARGYDNIPSSYGFDQDIDDLLFNEVCEVPSDIKYIVEYYQCVSFERILAYFADIMRSYANTISVHHIYSKELYIFGSLINSRLALGFLDLTNKYEEIMNDTINNFKLIIWVCFSIVTICAILAFIAMIMIVVIIERELDTFKCILLRINPVTFATNSQVLSLVYGKKSFVDTHIISASHSVFYSSQDAMMSLNQDGIIESLNPAASEIFGYTPEQMLGQNLKLLINPEIKTNNQLFYTMQLMKSGQCGLIFESDFAGSKDDETIMPLKVTLLGFSSNDRVAESFAIVCRDKTEEDKQKAKVESAQKDSENLLQQFVPKEMLAKISKDEPELAFSVPSSTVIFINISQFSIYMATIPPSELLMNLGKIFSSFDKIASNIASITKIKVMGDIYFAAGGLFNTPDTPPSTHATDVTNFALNALDSIEELNIQMNANLQIRIGVHTGGPVTAGVLGMNRQIFDIIGSTITACQQLEESCIPGNVNISTDTYQLIQNGPYQIKEHEEIELKGLGKQMSYTIAPGHVTASGSTASAYTPPSLDALLSGGSSVYTVPSLDALVGPASDYVFDSAAAFPDEGNNNGGDGGFQLPSLSSLINPTPT